MKKEVIIMIKNILGLIRFGIECNRIKFDSVARDTAKQFEKDGKYEYSEYISGLLGDIPTFKSPPYRLLPSIDKNTKEKYENRKESLLKFAENIFQSYQGSNIYMVLVNYCEPCDVVKHLYAPTYFTLNEILYHYDDNLNYLHCHNVDDKTYEYIKTWYFEVP